jgi:hypothetical protein
VRTCSSLLPSQPTGTWCWTSSLGRPGGQRGAAACAPAKRRPRCGVDPCASHNRGRSRRTDARDPAWYGQRGCSGRGHRTPGCPHTWITPVVWTPIAWTPDTWTPDAPGHRCLDTGCPPDQLDGGPSAWRTADADSATNGVAGVRTSWTATTTAMPAGRPKPRSDCSVCGAHNPRRLRVPAPAAAVTGQPRSTARHEAAPWRTAVLRRFRVESRAAGWGSSVMASAYLGGCCGVLRGAGCALDVGVDGPTACLG